MHHKTFTYGAMKTWIENVSINSIQFNLFHFLSIHYKVKDHMDTEIVTIQYKLYMQNYSFHNKISF